MTAKIDVHLTSISDVYRRPMDVGLFTGYKFEKRVQKILNDENTYRLLPNSKQAQIERQANSLVKSISKNNFNKIETEKLLSTGSKPANFAAFIKDHKVKDEDGYPLRPIASVRNTATEKVDWLVSASLQI